MRRSLSHLSLRTGSIAAARSKANLGTGASLVAAAALMVDYVLNVAVGISAGVGALVSAVPSLRSNLRRHASISIKLTTMLLEHRC